MDHRTDDAQTEALPKRDAAKAWLHRTHQIELPGWAIAASGFAALVLLLIALD